MTQTELTDAEIRSEFDKLYPGDGLLLDLAENNRDFAVEAIGARHHWRAFLSGARAIESAVLSRTTTRALPHPGSAEASAMMDSVLAEYNWPANSKNAARAGWEAANRWLSRRPAAGEGVSNLITLNRPMLEELLALTVPGDDDDEPVEVSLRHIENGPDGHGLYAHYEEYPEEGVTLIDGKSDVLRAEGRASVASPSAQTAAPAPADERTPQDYAIEHAEYMAQAGEALLTAIIHRDAAYAVIEEIETDRTPTDDEREQYMRTIEAQNEHAIGLRECIYEFRKRRDRAAALGVQPSDGGQR